jgi:hypothetical protein
MRVSGLNAWFLSDLSGIDPAEWNGLLRPEDSPFMEWEWLELLERSGSVGPEAGWTPAHLVLRRGHRLAAAAPLYVKPHSEGEFVFDYIWADAARQLGLRYYPKLLGMSPFTPTGGYRFLISPEEDSRSMTRTMVSVLEAWAKAQGLQGAAFNFADPVWAGEMEELGYLRWDHQSFVWENHGYQSFDDFLARFRSQARKSIRRERRELAGRGVEVRPIPGEAITPELMRLMYELYVKTNDKFGVWGCEYLTADVFEQLTQRFRDHLLLMAAWEEDDPVPVGMALLAHKGGEMWGRYWGCRREIPFLHFETCLYGPVIWAIEQGIRRFYPGIGGEHKMRRGFVSEPAISLHKLFHPSLAALLKTYLPAVNSLERNQIEALNSQLPFASKGE